jgi:hypothetical protein
MKDRFYFNKMPRDNDGTLPENHGKSWLKQDEDLLLKKISNREPIGDISNYFKRTEGGIRSRLREIACRFVEDGKTLEEASKYTTIPVEDIEKSLKLRNISSSTKKLFNFSMKREETLLSVAIEIRDLLKELLKK